MSNSNLFKQAHKLTKQTIKQGDSYRYTFGQCLKQIQAEIGKHTQTIYSMNAEPMTITTYSKAKKVNKSVALIGDYKKPVLKRDGLKVHHFKNDTLTATYNIDTLLSFIITTIAVIAIYMLALQAI